MDIETGEMEAEPIAAAVNPSFVVPRAEGRGFWVITEPEQGGEVVSFELVDRRVQEVGRLRTGADAPCHLAVDAERGLAYVSHYHGGAVAVLALARDGAPSAGVAMMRAPQAWDGVDRAALRSRPHAAALVPGTEEVLVADCGRDVLLLYRVRATVEGATAELLDALLLPPGTGPRHVAFHAELQVAFVSNQNDAGVSVVRRVIDGDRPRLELTGILPVRGLGRQTAIPSEIALHPTEPVLYMANRADDSLSVLEIVSETGALVERSTVDVLGRNPRHFAVHPDGGLVLVANQDSDDVVSFRLEDRGRTVSWTGHRLAVDTPTCVAYRR